jgi:membrane protease YdiL (CAAX protease family)
VNSIVQKDKYRLIFDIFIASVIIICAGFLLIDNLSSPLKYFPTNYIYIFCTLVSLILGTSYLYIKYPIAVSHFGFDNQNIRNTIIWGINGFIALILLNFPYKIILGEKSIPKEQFIETQQGMHFVFLFLVITVILIPFVEELFYRAFLFRLVKNKFGLVAGYVVATSFFTLGHMFSKLSIINSLIFCYIYEKTGRIGTTIIAHTLLNFVWYTAVYVKAEGAGLHFR